MIDLLWKVVEQRWQTRPRLLSDGSTVHDGEDVSWQVRTEDDRCVTTVYDRQIAEHVVSLHNARLGIE